MRLLVHRHAQQAFEFVAPSRCASISLLKKRSPPPGALAMPSAMWARRNSVSGVLPWSG
jgi:hypothetical protein